jgi:hypothetical protein
MKTGIPSCWLNAKVSRNISRSLLLAITICTKVSRNVGDRHA